MTTATPSQPEARRLDLSLFRLPTDADPGNAEVGIGQRGHPGQAVKRRFWGTLAKRLDLTGRGSLVRSHPYGTGHDRVLAGLEESLERLMASIEARNQTRTVLPTQTKPSQLPRQVAQYIEEVTPQFFLRNIPRVERPAVNVRRLGYRYVVWREDESELMAFARRPHLEPVEFIAELSTAAMVQLRQEAWQRVYGLNWENDVGNFRPATFRVPTFGAAERGRIPISELSDQAAPAGRENSQQLHVRTLKELGKRFDGSKD